MNRFQAAICVTLSMAGWSASAQAQVRGFEFSQQPFMDAVSSEKVPTNIALRSKPMVAEAGSDQWDSTAEIRPTRLAADFGKIEAPRCWCFSFGGPSEIGRATRHQSAVPQTIEVLEKFECLETPLPASPVDRSRYSKLEPEDYVLVDFADTQLLGLAQQP